MAERCHPNQEPPRHEHANAAHRRPTAHPEIYDVQGTQYDSTLVTRAFARSLERENAAATARIAGLLSTLGRVQKATIARNATLEEWLYVQANCGRETSRFIATREQHDAAWF